MAQTGIPIRSLQRMLRVIAGYDSDVLSVVPDGIYGRNTMDAVRSFQQKYGLPITGVTDLPTWELVVVVFRRAEIEIGPAQPVLVVLQPAQKIMPGETNENLFLSQAMLIAIGKHFNNAPQLAVTGIADEATVRAVSWLQVIIGAAPTGVLDRTTWLHLARLYRAAVGDGTHNTPPH